MLNDLRYALRHLLKSPGFAAVAILILALGIGATTAIFSMVNGVLLRPLPYPEAGKIIYFNGQNLQRGISDSNISVSDFLDWTNQSQAFAKTALFWTGDASFAASGGEPERVPRAGVTTNFFDVLGVQPMLGRAFLASEDQPTMIPVAILSEGLWHRRFGSDRKIIGKTITISARPITVVGVMPRSFDFPQNTQIWTTSGINVAEEPRDNRSYSAVGRLKSGVDLKQAQTQISAINRRLAQAYPDTNKGWDAQLVVLHEQLVGSVRPSLLILLGAVCLVLLIGCANITNLLLARAAARQKEVAIRTALGASRTRVVRQMLTESLLLSALGGSFGLILSAWLIKLFISISPPGSPRFSEITLDYSVLSFTVVLSVLTGILFGLVPAMQTSNLNVTGSLNQGGRSGVEGYRRTSARSLLLIGEVAVSLMLLIGAGLLIQSFMRLQDVKPGFNPERVLIASISLPYAKYTEDQQRIEFFRSLQERLKALPGLQAVGAGVNLPLGASQYLIGRSFIPEGRPLNADESVNASWSTITPGYFEALQIPLLTGRNYNQRDNDSSTKVVIVSRTAAIKHFGSESAAIGKRLRIWRDEEFPREIVGVVGDIKSASLQDESGPQIYTPHSQDGSWGFMTLTIRTAADPAAMTTLLRREVLGLDKDLPIFNVRTMEDAVSASIGTRRVSMLLFTVFAGAALLLAAIGIYGVMAYTVSQRTQEIGIRMALGAQKSEVLRMIVRQGMTLAILGVGVGLVGALGLTKTIATLLFGVAANDPASFVGISALVLSVAFLACYLPARRASKVAPLIALSRG